MAIQIQETFQVVAPRQKVWDFMMGPENIIACMPGASLEEILSETSFVGGVKLKIGAITTKYNGTITYTEMDTTNYTVVLLAEAKEKSGGTITGTITCNLTALDDNNTEVFCESNVDLTGKIVQVGRGMIDGVAAQIIGKFVANVKKRLEPAEGEAATISADGVESIAPQATIERDKEDDSINVLAVVWHVVWGGIANFFKKLFGRG